MREYPKPIQDLIDRFTYLPGVGPKTALRYVFYLLKQPKGTIQSLADSLNALQDTIIACKVCKTYTTQELCEICSNQRRDKSTICVVSQPRDVATIEATGFNGLYHVLGGTLSPIEGITPDTLEIQSLFQRIKENSTITEIILAFNPDIEGESTTRYL